MFRYPPLIYLRFREVIWSIPILFEKRCTVITVLMTQTSFRTLKGCLKGKAADTIPFLSISDSKYHVALHLLGEKI